MDVAVQPLHRTFFCPVNVSRGSGGYFNEAPKCSNFTDVLNETLLIGSLWNYFLYSSIFQLLA